MSPLRIAGCLSLTGRYARFGTQAARGLRAWAELTGDAEVVLFDDGSDPARVTGALRDAAGRGDLLLGPYSTQLMRAANRVIVDLDRLLWNHGGSGDDVEQAQPGHVVSVLAPTSRYAEPYVRRLADSAEPRTLRLAHGRGPFGRQVVAGAAALAAELGVPTAPLDPSTPPEGAWDLFCAATFEEDVELVRTVLGWSNRPATIGTVAAGVTEFAEHVPDPEGTFGIAQWMPGASTRPELGPTEPTFLRAYGSVPDYPAVQAVAAAVLAVHCAHLTGDLSRPALWAAATALDTSTLFGAFRVDPHTGAQQAARTVLTRWNDGALDLA